MTTKRITNAEMWSVLVRVQYDAERRMNFAWTADGSQWGQMPNGDWLTVL